MCTSADSLPVGGDYAGKVGCRLGTTAREDGVVDCQIPISGRCSSSMLTSLKVTTDTDLTNRAER